MSLGQPLAPLTNPRTALKKYVRAPDEHYSFVVADVEEELLLTRHTIRMQSVSMRPSYDSRARSHRVGFQPTRTGTADYDGYFLRSIFYQEYLSTAKRQGTETRKIARGTRVPDSLRLRHTELREKGKGRGRDRLLGLLRRSGKF
jgi:hypothetical protein